MANNFIQSAAVIVHVACVASVSVGFPHKFRCFGREKIGARAKTKEGGREEKRKQRFLFSSPPPLSFFLALAPIFARPKHRNLCGNPMETLATQAIVHAYLVSGKQDGRIIYQNSTWRTALRKTFARLFSAVGLCFSIFLYVLFHSSISLSNFLTLLFRQLLVVA